MRVSMPSRQAPRFHLQPASASSARANVPATAIGLRRSEGDRYASSRCLRVDENHLPRKIASRVVRPAIVQSWFSPLLKRQKQSRSSRISLPPTPDSLYEESDKHKKRVEDPNAHDSLLVRQWIARHVRITYLDNNQGESEGDHRSFANYRHRISRQVKHDPHSEQRYFQCELRVSIIPQTETDFPSVVVNREITRMGDEIENPMRENGDTNNQRG